ncbi:L,D-transpeptidase [Agrobacterium sp. RAC06]|uniref:L,D-transpeptidase n=1 Tax=Agrobacterium sp. RAC06 TaxID=1842536 RepID=UPI00083DF931|nr:L,D-transpeptidase [Agrobacterium sp. RAC06]AOG09297.1 L,D-transpeptidase catalytic domain protein [Agrobacterium sp. RAC06]
MTKTDDDRRLFVKGISAVALLGSPVALLAGEVMKEVAALKPGEFTWHPERQRTGPVAIVVSLPEQRVHVYRNGIRIAVATCSTGKPGHETPTGVFVVLQKDKHHKSSTYDDAPMPNMSRLTWSGIALHAGNLPGYPASHGCVRLPMAFSERLFDITHLGTPVIISGAAADPQELTHPGMVLGAYAAREFGDAVAALHGKQRPNDWTDLKKQPVVSVIMSTFDGRALLVENSEIRAEGRITVSGRDKFGSHVFLLDDLDDAVLGMRWIAFANPNEDEAVVSTTANLLSRISADPPFVSAMQRVLHPGAVLILTDAPLAPDSRTGTDFVIMS